MPGKRIEPSKSLLQRIFGSEEFDPKIKAAIEMARKESPDLASVEPYGPLSKQFMKGAYGWTTPGGRILLNQEQLRGLDREEVIDTILHENQHSKQIKARGLGPTMEFLKSAFFTPYSSYGQRPDEMEAFQIEKDRRMRMGRPPGYGFPNFSDTGVNTRGDILLPSRRKNGISR